MKNLAVLIIIIVQLWRITTRLQKERYGLVCAYSAEFFVTMWLLNKVW